MYTNLIINAECRQTCNDKETYCLPQVHTHPHSICVLLLLLHLLLVLSLWISAATAVVSHCASHDHQQLASQRLRVHAGWDKNKERRSERETDKHTAGVRMEMMIFNMQKLCQQTSAGQSWSRAKFVLCEKTLLRRGGGSTYIHDTTAKLHNNNVVNEQLLRWNICTVQAKTLFITLLLLLQQQQQQQQPNPYRG